MSEPPFDHIQTVIGSAGTALLCSVLTQCLSSTQSELYSEIVCWILLPVIFKIARRPGIERFSKLSSPGYHEIRASGASLWIVAASLVTFCVFKAEFGLVGLFPTLTPLLFIAEKHIGSELRASVTPYSRFFSFFVDTALGTVLAASFIVVTLTDCDVRGYALSAIPVAALLVVYVTLTPRAKYNAGFLPNFDMENVIVPFSLRVIIMVLALLGFESIAFGFPKSKIVLTFALGLSKALTWFFAVQVARRSSWLAVTAIETFSLISTRDPSTLSSDVLASSHVIASFLALAEVIQLLPGQRKAKSGLWVFLLVSLVPYVTNNLAIRSAHSSQIRSPDHPVEGLIRNAKLDFENLIKNQSETYKVAHEEYRRRYGIEPPSGFDSWFQFAKEHQSPIIDDFDMIQDSISPFLKLSGKEVLQIMSDIQAVPYNELWGCEFSGSEAKTQCSNPYRTINRDIHILFDRLLGELPGILPDVKFLVNHNDEPKALVTPPSLGDEPYHNGWFNFIDMSRQSSWDVITKFCSVQENGDRFADETFGLPFVNNPASAMDLCRHPEYKAMHGLFLSPPSFRLFQGLAPILSSGSVSTMGDILFPSPAYIQPEFQYVDNHDVEWEKKWNNLYWAGSNTGGFSIGDQWPNFHRQRFVKLAQNLGKGPHSYLREKGGMVSHVKSSFLNSRLYDVTFTRIFQCKTKYCRDQRAFFNVKSWADKDRALRSRLVFDIDGNGISGRYYKLLASKSTPLKQTLLHEWHDERLIPWFHYIPVSQSMEELPELVAYLTTTEAGQKRAREIAEQGRHWFSKAFREIDMTIYIYRLLLELARLQDPERPAK